MNYIPVKSYQEGRSLCFGHELRVYGGYFASSPANILAYSLISLLFPLALIVFFHFLTAQSSQVFTLLFQKELLTHIHS